MAPSPGELHLRVCGARPTGPGSFREEKVARSAAGAEGAVVRPLGAGRLIGHGSAARERSASGPSHPRDHGLSGPRGPPGRRASASWARGALRKRPTSFSTASGRAENQENADHRTHLNRVFEREASDPDARYSRRERSNRTSSSPSLKGHSAVIKTHHNVAAPREPLELIEPVRELFRTRSGMGRRWGAWGVFEGPLRATARGAIRGEVRGEGAILQKADEIVL